MGSSVKRGLLKVLRESWWGETLHAAGEAAQRKALRAVIHLWGYVPGGGVGCAALTDEENLSGLELYFEMTAAAGQIPRAKPLEFAAAAAQSAARRSA